VGSRSSLRLTFRTCGYVQVARKSSAHLPSRATAVLRLYLYPRFGEVRLDAITAIVKDYLASLVAAGKLSRNTLRLIVCTIR